MGGCWNTPYGGYGQGYGYGGQGYGPGYGPGYGYGSVVGGPIIDADPITPGIQGTPGVVTQVGPSTISGIAPGYGGYGGYRGSAIGIASALPPVGYGTSVYPSVNVLPPPTSTIIPPVMAPPIVPPIMSPNVTVTSLGPAGGLIGGGVPAFGPGMRTGLGLDLDPITPGIQMNPGLVTATGPSYILGR